MLGQIGPGFDVFSTSVFSALLPAILVGGAVYLVVSLTQGRASFQTETARGEPAGAENPVLRTLYALAVAVLVAAFVGFGIGTFYPAPEPPREDTPVPGETPPLPPIDENDPSTAEPPPILPGEAGEFQSRIEAYERELADHDRVTSVVAIVVAVLILIAALISGLSRLPVIGEGVTLGGVLTLLYGMILGVQAPSGLLEFFVVAVGLIVLLVVLYRQFRRTGRTVHLDRTSGA